MEEQTIIEFPTKKEPMNIQEMDHLCKSLGAAKKEYEEKKKASDEAYAVRKELEAKVLDELNRAGMKNFKSNYGTVTRVDKLSYKTPKLLEDKEAFFNWLSSEFDSEVCKTLMTVNSRSLNSFLNEQGATDIPGIGNPTENITLSFRRN